MYMYIIVYIHIYSRFLCHGICYHVDTILIVEKPDPSDMEEGSSEISPEEKMEVNEETNVEEQVETIIKEVSEIWSCGMKISGITSAEQQNCVVHA